MSEQSFLKKHLIVTMLFGVLLVIFGVAMLSSKGRLFIILMGIGLILSGLSTLQVMFSLHRELKDTAVKLGGNVKAVAIIKSVVSIVLGFLGIIYSKESINVLMYVMGAQMVVSAGIALYDAIILKKNTGLPVASLVTDGIYSLVIALVLFVFPSGVGTVIATVISIILIVTGISLFIWAFKIRKIDKDFVEAKAEIIDEK